MRYDHLITEQHAQVELAKLQGAFNYNAVALLKDFMRRRGWSFEAKTVPSPPAFSPSTPLFKQNIPAALKEVQRWCVWQKQADGRKIPYRVLDGGYWSRSQRCKSDTPEDWVSFAEALQCFENANGHIGGLSFALGDGYCGFDFDDVIVGGTMHPQAKSWLARLGGYSEVSQSGSGQKTVLRGTLGADFLASAETGRQFKNIPSDGMATEVYDKRRFFFLTGNGTGEPLENQREIDAICSELVALKDSRQPKAKARQRPRTTLAIQLSDAAVLEKIRASQARRGSVTFEMLWSGQIGAYPSASEADWALTKILMWWCNNDKTQVERLFEQSELAKREKWDREDYRERTLAKAVCDDGYSPPQPSKRQSAALAALRGGSK